MNLTLPGMLFVWLLVIAVFLGFAIWVIGKIQVGPSWLKPVLVSVAAVVALILALNLLPGVHIGVN